MHINSQITAAKTAEVLMFIKNHPILYCISALSLTYAQCHSLD